MKMHQIFMSLLLIFASILLGFNSSAQNESISTLKQEMDLNSFLLDKGYKRIALTKVVTGHLHILGTLNGVKGSFILDTGASGTIIEIKNKKRFKMQTEASELQAAGAGATSIQMESSPKNQLKLGELVFEERGLMMMNLDHVNQALERFDLEKVDGIIGADILTDYEAVIDYINLALYLKKIVKNL